MKKIKLGLWIKGLCEKAVAKEIIDMEGSRTINKCVAQNGFGHFKVTPASKSNLSQRDLLLWKIGLAWNAQTTAKHKHLYMVTRYWSFRKLNRCYWEALQELTNDHAKHVNICKQLLTNSQDAHFWCWIVTGDGISIYFHNLNKKKSALFQRGCRMSYQKRAVWKEGNFIVFGGVSGCFKGVLHFALVPDGHAVNTDIYAQQLQWVYTFKAHYLDLVN